MAVNKVIYNNNTLIDLTSDTVDSDALLNGYTAHDKSGVIINGSVQFSSIYSGSNTPSSSLGQDGDIYLQT